MSRWLQRIRLGAITMALAATVLNCGGGDGGGGGSTLRLFFGMNGDGSCNSVVVDVDLADAEAVLARVGAGAPDCAIDSALAGSGCVATFNELSGGTRLRVTISGCVIPAVSNLFACNFEQVDVSDLNTESSAQCACTVLGCDGTPPLCIDADADPRSCEDCLNGTDDDGNGLVDCDDPNCENFPACGSTTTTIPTSTTTTSTTTTNTSTTTTASLTTTTLPVPPISINFLLTSSDAPVGALQFTVNYTSAPGQFEGSGATVSCENQVDGALFAPNNKASIRKLSLGWISLGGFAAPTELASCVFNPGTPEPVPANFTVVIDDAADVDGEPIDVDVDVTVTSAP